MLTVNKLAVIRLKGSVDLNGKKKDTLSLLRLSRPYYCTLVDNDPQKLGMLQKLKEMVTWGQIEPDVLEELLLERGELEGGKEVTDEVVDEKTPYSSVAEFAEAICEGEAELDALDGLKKVFRLHPSKKGFKSMRRSFSHGGAVGDRGDKINDLIDLMM